MNHENTQELPLEEVIGDRFGRYSKYIIQDRALPDARDGLKPVQRRILYAMYEDNNTFDKPFRKSAKTVGNVIGNYHPHGDSSVYEAMVRMSQDWKLRSELIEMHGNNGSIDGDPPAAMRYTEARISKLASQLLLSIDKKTVDKVPNFDDSLLEPTVLPANFPNLLVNGATGISAGYATDIPAHNLAEVINAVIMRMEKPECTVSQLMTVLPGPDFPTGGIIQGSSGIRQAYETGKGKIILRAKTKVITEKNGRSRLVITEVPFECNKASLVKKMDDIRLDRKIDGIIEVRDESDRQGLQIVVEIKKEIDPQVILHYLYKHTDLQVAFNFNMVAINDRRPMMMNLIELLDAYIAHRKEIVLRRSKYDLNKAKEREHIVVGFIKALSILDEVIVTIRASKDKKNAKTNLMQKFSFTEKQAEGIVMLQLYRLTNTDVVELQNEAKELAEIIKNLSIIISSQEALNKIIKDELKEIKKQFASKRRSVIEENIEEIKITKEQLIGKEETIVSVTCEGYIKRSSIRSYSASNGNDIGLKESDKVLKIIETHTLNTMLLFTNKGNYLVLPVHQIPEIRWKDVGQYIGNFFPIDSDEKIITVLSISDYERPVFVTYVTEKGIVKRTELKSLKVQRISKPIVGIKLKTSDRVQAVFITDGYQYLFLGSKKGRELLFFEGDIPVLSTKATGVIGMKIASDDDYIIASATVNNLDGFALIMITDSGQIYKFKLASFEIASRSKIGELICNNLKKANINLIGMHVIDANNYKDIFVKLLSGETKLLPLNDINYFTKRKSSIYTISLEKNDKITTTWGLPEIEKMLIK